MPRHGAVVARQRRVYTRLPTDVRAARPHHPLGAESGRTHGERPGIGRDRHQDGRVGGLGWHQTGGAFHRDE
eukprot:2732855-Heterocapsa_arctica.AAC.1